MDGPRNALQAIETDVTTVYVQHLEQLDARLDAARAVIEKTYTDLSGKATEQTNKFVETMHQVLATLEPALSAFDESVKTADAAGEDLKSTYQHFDASRATENTEFEAALHRLEAAYKKIDADASTALGTVNEHAATYVQEVDAQTHAAGEHGTHLASGLERTHQGFADELVSMAQTLHGFARQVDATHHEHDTQHEANAVQTHQNTTAHLESNIATLQEGLAVVGQALDILDRYSGDFGGSFGDGVKGLMGTVESIAAIVDEIRPVLDVIKAIE